MGAWERVQEGRVEGSLAYDGRLTWGSFLNPESAFQAAKMDWAGGSKGVGWLSAWSGAQMEGWEARCT